MSLELNETTLVNLSALVNYWRFEGNSNDSKGSLNGADTSIDYNASYGKFGQGARFNDVGDKITIAKKANQAEGTINFWVYPHTNFTTEKMLISDRDGTSRDGSFQLQIGTDAKLNLLVNGGSGWVINITSTNAMSVDNWYFVSWVWDATNGHKVYVNGALWMSSATVRNVFTNVNSIIIGNLYSNTFGANKYMDDMSIFSRALITSEINGIYYGYLNKNSGFLSNPLRWKNN